MIKLYNNFLARSTNFPYPSESGKTKGMLRGPWNDHSIGFAYTLRLHVNPVVNKPSLYSLEHMFPVGRTQSWPVQFEISSPNGELNPSI
jgi:hypothetical protein